MITVAIIVQTILHFIKIKMAIGKKTIKIIFKIAMFF